MKWIPISEKLPDIDELVLWLYESGGIIYDCLDKETDVKSFLRGTFASGKITHWMIPVYPSIDKEGESKHIEKSATDWPYLGGLKKEGE